MMKQRLVLLTVITLFVLAPTVGVSPLGSEHVGDSAPYTSLDSQSVVSDAGGSGLGVTNVVYMTRKLSGLTMGFYNSYTDPSHEYSLDLSSYQIAGWTVDSVIVNATSITAAPERVSLGVDTSGGVKIRIWNDTAGSGYTTEGLFQAFYNRPHDGRLENYSLSYISPMYDPSQFGYAYLVVRSDYSDLSKNVSGFISPFTQNFSAQVVTHDCSGDNAILNASTYYFVVIDGTAMWGKKIAGVWYYNQIFWQAESRVGLETGYRLWDFSQWYSYNPTEPTEAELNYTYTPWNKTSNAPAVYASAQEIGLTANGSAESGAVWTYTSTKNITLIQYATTQAVNVVYDLTLRYTKTVAGSVKWGVVNSGDPIQWNMTTDLTYPDLSGTLARFMNASIQADWNPTGLYNSTQTNYGHFSKSGSTAICTAMTNGTWTLSSTAPNYVRSVDKYIAATDEPIGDYVSILSNTEINATVWDGSDNHITGGTANLTITDSQGTVQTSTVTPNDGIAPFLWDISSTTTGNGTHSLGVFWTNGTEAGYYVTEVFVYYSTSMTADSTDIHAYADSTFDIGIDFNRVFPAAGLGGSFAAVTYSFDTTVNATLTDQGNGRWTQTVSTAGMTDGVYTLWVYAEGYALENRSLAITVTVSYETLALNWSWSDTNSITYLESTNLTVTYQTTGGTRVSNAMVNVTFQGQTFDLSWDPVSENYWILLHGENFTGIPDTFTLNVSAWRDGYSPRFNDTLQITVSSESAVSFLVEWNPSSGNLTFIDSIEILVTYNYGGSPIPGATVRALFNGSSPVDLNYNATAQKWQVVLNCSDYLGAWTIQIDASRDGYASGTDSKDWR
ncbi:MAG: hypothetical protein ACP6KW_11235, partial [Candidatus Thorarchaeota archaeon]